MKLNYWMYAIIGILYLVLPLFAKHGEWYIYTLSGAGFASCGFMSYISRQERD